MVLGYKLITYFYNNTSNIFKSSVYFTCNLKFKYFMSKVDPISELK